MKAIGLIPLYLAPYSPMFNPTETFFNELKCEFRSLPQIVMDDVIYISAGSFHSFAITSDARLWGWETKGEVIGFLLGVGEERTKLSNHTPVHIMCNVIAVSTGNQATLAVTSDGRLWEWGWICKIWMKRSGMFNLPEKRFYPTHILDDVVSVSMGHMHALAVDINGNLWSWGGNSNAELGDSTGENRPKPLRVIRGC